LSFVKQNILTIIGILTLVIGIGYFVKYAIDKNWIGETTRFIIGMLTGFGIMAIGYFIQKNYKTFSSIISGGGIAILYQCNIGLPRIPSIYAKYCLYIFSIHYHFGSNYSLFLQQRSAYYLCVNWRFCFSFDGKQRK
jgi:hypothetical protein